MSPKSKDLFDDSRMSFGEHLEELRVRLIQALIGLTIGVLVSLCFGHKIVGIVRQPIDAALIRFGKSEIVEEEQATWNPWLFLQGKQQEVPETNPDVSEDDVLKEEPIDQERTIALTIDRYDFLMMLHRANPDLFPIPDVSEKGKPMQLRVKAQEFLQWNETSQNLYRPVTFNVQEAFLIYLKVSLAAGFLLASPWIFYQLWMFIAVGLYEHERKYLYVYGSLSLLLFIVGSLFCFYVVFPFALDFFLSYNKFLGVTPQLRLSEYISFALILPAGFGLSFELPLVMFALERMNIVEKRIYREQRKMAVLVIAFLSMVLTPSDPYTMILMMIPLLLLYELGVWMCDLNRIPVNPTEVANRA